MWRLKERAVRPDKRAVIKRLVVLLAIMILCASVLLYGYIAYTRTGTIIPTAELFDGRPTFRFVDVGQGDCTLITYHGKAVLVDTGTTESRHKTADYVRLYAPNIDYLIITHPHEDHMGGAAELISKVNVKNLVMRDIIVEDSFFSETLETAGRRGTNVIRIDSPVEYDSGGIHIEILNVFDLDYDDLNDASMVTKVTAGGTSVLLTGDAEKDEEAFLVSQEGEKLSSDILKLGHHGSNTSTGEDFLKAVSPEICVISCGRNNVFGHPAPIVLERIRNIGAEIYRTDKSGTIVLRGEK